MNFSDMIKKSVMDQFSGGLSADKLLLSLLVAFVVSLFVGFIYKKTYSGVCYTKNTVLTIILLAMVTSLVIRTINSNLALSLGMVGALSIVRFRTAVKDSVDTVYMFWAITVGIMAGAGLYLITVMASVLLGIFYLLSKKLVFKAESKYLIVINTKTEYTSDILDYIMSLKNAILKTESIKQDEVELTFEITGVDSAKLLLDIKKKNGIDNVHLISID